MSTMNEPDEHHVAVNRAHWDRTAPEMVASAERLWASERITWGLWDLPESEVGLLGDPPIDLAGLRAIELGCGTAYVAGWLARRGASVTGVDVSPQQLSTARRLADAHRVDLTLLEADAEATGLPPGTFDLAVSEYGASLWCDPERWIVEAARLLRPGGRLAFLTSSPFVSLASPVDGSLPVTERFERPWFELERLDWRGALDLPGGIEFVAAAPRWIRILRAAGFDVVDHRELRPPAGAADPGWGVPPAWANRWPSEQTWVAIRR
jgi:SAM-dependent methyltransferase